MNPEYDEGWDDGYEYGLRKEPPGIAAIYVLCAAIGFVWGVFLTLLLTVWHG